MNIEMNDLRPLHALIMISCARGAVCPMGTVQLELTLGTEPAKAEICFVEHIARFLQPHSNAI